MRARGLSWERAHLTILIVHTIRQSDAVQLKSARHEAFDLALN